MKPALKIFTLSLLLFNTIGALYGGYNLTIYPDGSSLGLSITLLQHSGFTDFFIPGLVLFIFNGLFGIITLLAVLFNTNRNSFFVLLQGVVLTGWIIVQIILIRTFSYFHAILGCMGIALIIVGLAGIIKASPRKQYQVNH